MDGNTPAAPPAVADALRPLGIALYAAVAVVVGLLFRWLIQLDGTFDPANVYFANFLIGAGALVGAGALLVVAKVLVELPEKLLATPAATDDDSGRPEARA